MNGGQCSVYTCWDQVLYCLLLGWMIFVSENRYLFCCYIFFVCVCWLPNDLPWNVRVLLFCLPNSAPPFVLGSGCLLSLAWMILKISTFFAVIMYFLCECVCWLLNDLPWSTRMLLFCLPNSPSLFGLSDTSYCFILFFVCVFIYSVIPHILTTYVEFRGT